MCMLNDSVCILCYTQICLDGNIYDPSVSVTYAQLFCTQVGIVTVHADPYAQTRTRMKSHDSILLT